MKGRSFGKAIDMRVTYVRIVSNNTHFAPLYSDGAHNSCDDHTGDNRLELKMFLWQDRTNVSTCIDEIRQIVVEKISSQARIPTDGLKIRNLSISLTLLCNQGC